MQIDRRDLERHYASLSDDALLAMNPDDLVEMARDCWQAELRSRNLQPRGRCPRRSVNEEAAGVQDDAAEEGIEPDTSAHVTLHRFFDAGDAGEARDALEAAGIECVIEGVEGKNTGEYRAPSQFLLKVDRIHKDRGETILATHVFNPVQEETYRSFFASLDDDDLIALDLSTFVAHNKGNQDLRERVQDAYLDELDQRELPHPEFDENVDAHDDAWNEVGASLAKHEAGLAQRLLEQAGIPWQSRGEEGHGISILVAPEHYDAACEALEQGMTEEALQALDEEEAS